MTATPFPSRRAHPLALVLTRAMYEANPATFDALAAKSQSNLVPIPDEGIRQEEFEQALVSAVAKARALRGQSVPP